MPFAGPPGAYWLLLADGVHLPPTGYDVRWAAERFRSSGSRDVESLAVRYVLHPPTEVESLKMLAGIEERD